MLAFACDGPWRPRSAFFQSFSGFSRERVEFNETIYVCAKLQSNRGTLGPTLRGFIVVLLIPRRVCQDFTITYPNGG